MSNIITNHTADIGIKEKAKNIKLLFKKCAEKIVKLALVTKSKKNNLSFIKLSINNKSNSYEDLLHDFLNEIIFYIFVKKNYIYKIVIKKILKNKVNAIIYYRKIIYGEIKRELKSVTYHNLKIKKHNKFYMAEFIIDT